MSATTEALRPAAPEADPEGEVFEVLDEHGDPIGTELRSVVHAKGLYHRAVYCFLFNDQGQVLLQKRSPQKKVGPSQWDLSVAEHLQPGESYIQAVHRGLAEELGLGSGHLTAEHNPLKVHGPLAPVHKRHLDIPERQIFDYEFVESYSAAWDGSEVRFNPAEVAAVRWEHPAEIRRQMAAEPEAFTLWFREELESLGYLKEVQPPTGDDG